STTSFDAIPKACLLQFNKRDGLGKFYIWGWAKYKDTETPEEHITRFCWDVDQAVFSADGSTVRLSHKLCPRGNCPDKPCPEPEHGSFLVRVFSCRQEIVPLPGTISPQQPPN